MIDLDCMHALLWFRSNDGLLHLNQTQFADEMCVNKLVIHRVLKRMEDQGRLRCTAGTGPSPRTYMVLSPDEWLATRPAPSDPSAGDEPSTPTPSR